MASRMRLRPSRVCAMMVALWLPFAVAAGPTLDTNDLRRILRAMDAQTALDATRPADTQALRDMLGLGATPAPIAAETSQDAPPQTAAAPVPQPPAVKPALAPLELRPIAAAAQGAAGGLFRLQTGQAPAGTAAPTGTIPSAGAGGLFAAQNAQTKTTAAPRPVIAGTQTLINPNTTPLRAAEPTAAATGAATGTLGDLFAAQKGGVPDAAQGALPKPLDVSTTNFRLMLATLAQVYTGRNNLSVVTAQGARGAIALSVRSGTVGLEDLQAFSALHGAAPRADGSLTIPVVIWPEATLRLTPGDRLALARDTGAFILSMGQLDIQGAVIEVTGPKNPHEPVFEPFVTVAAGGSLHMDGATLRGLGFGQTVKFAGLTVAGNPLMPTKQDVVIRNSLFEQMRTVTIAGAPGALVEGNTFQDARNNALNVVGSVAAIVRGNLFRGESPTNAVRVDVGSDRVVLSDNIFLRGERVAVLIEGGSHGVVVRDNLIWQRDGGGIKFYKSMCARAEGNILIDNAQKGIEVRKSDDTVVRGNHMSGGRSAGVWISGQTDDARTAVIANTFERNAAGVSTATAGEIWLRGNGMRAQLPKLLDGDIAGQTSAVVGDLDGRQTLKLRGMNVTTHDAVAEFCGNNT